MSAAAQDGPLPVGYAGTRTDGRCPWRPSEWCPWRPSAEDERLLRLLARGMSDAEIAAEVHVSVHTVPHLLRRLADRLGTGGRGKPGGRAARVRLAVWAAERGYTRGEAG